MIQVNITRDNRKRIVSVIIKGHADAGPYGHDLVCAAVSAVSFGCFNAIEELCQYEPDVETKDNGGFLRITLSSQLDDQTDQKVQLLLEGMLISLRTIEQSYEQYIMVTES
jgi:uncharacterized protein YsxB (DUF464 family)